MAAITVGGIDLATLGFNFTDEGQALDAIVEVPQEATIPLMRGAIFLTPNLVPVREFTLKGYLDGANQAAVRTALHKLQALLGDGTPNNIILGDWPTVQISATCVKLPGLNFPDARAGSRANSQNEIPFAVEMTFRSANPYWADITPQTINFGAATFMPQGTAPGEPVLTSPVGVLATPVLTGLDFAGNTLWTCTLASLIAGQQYRITTIPGVMTVEKFVGGIWTNADASITAGRFPMILPSDGVAYQSATWPKLQASTGTWVATFSRQWR